MPEHTAIAGDLGGRVVAACVPLRKFLYFTLAGVILLFTAALLGGPVTSGGVFLLLPAPQRPADHDLAEDYEPKHKGGVTLSSGTYVREDEDLVVRGTPALILRRTYLSGYRAPKEFGIGTDRKSVV